MKKYFIIIVITFLVILYFLLPKSCQLDIKNCFNISDTCKRDLRIFLIRKIKSNKFTPYILPFEKTIDINTAEDWNIAKKLYKIKND